MSKPSLRVRGNLTASIVLLKLYRLLWKLLIAWCLAYSKSCKMLAMEHCTKNFLNSCTILDLQCIREFYEMMLGLCIFGGRRTDLWFRGCGFYSSCHYSCHWRGMSSLVIFFTDLACCVSQAWIESHSFMHPMTGCCGQNHVFFTTRTSCNLYSLCQWRHFKCYTSPTFDFGRHCNLWGFFQLLVLVGFATSQVWNIGREKDLERVIRI